MRKFIHRLKIVLNSKVERVLNIKVLLTKFSVEIGNNPLFRSLSISITLKCASILTERRGRDIQVNG